MQEPPAVAVSLYQRLGGHEPIAAIVDVLSRYILIDAELAHRFEHLDLEALRRHQAAFLGAAFDGPREYCRDTLRQVHQRLGITARDYRLFVDHFTSALRACDVPPALCTEVLERIAVLREDVVSADD